jgi:hypothetical protein
VAGPWAPSLVGCHSEQTSPSVGSASAMR